MPPVAEPTEVLAALLLRCVTAAAPLAPSTAVLMAPGHPRACYAACGNLSFGAGEIRKLFMSRETWHSQ
jgi:hypothetical protein